MNASGSLLVNALGLAGELTLPVLIAAVVAAAIAGVLRTATQVDDPALSFAGKLAGVGIVLLVGSSFFSGEIVEFTRRLWGGLEYYH